MTRAQIRDGAKWAAATGGGLAVGCLFALTVLAGLSAFGAQQAPPVPPHSHPDLEIRSLLYIASAVAFTVGAVWAVVRSMTGKLEEYVDKMEKRAEERLPELITAAVLHAIEDHDGNEDAHGKAARLRHAPMNGEMLILREEFETLLEQHKEIHRDLINRDPMQSPHKHRERACPGCGLRDASGDDHRALRGKG